MTQDSVIKSIGMIGKKWHIHYSLPFDTFCQGADSDINETTNQYGEMEYRISGILKVDVEKILADEGTKEIEGLRLVEALVTIASYADGNTKHIYSTLALDLNNTAEWYDVVRKIEAGK